MTRRGDDTAVIIVAAGSGTRFGAELPKQFCRLGDKPVVMHSIRRFSAALPEAQIIVVVSADRKAYWLDLCRRHGFATPHTVALGGATRWQSVKNALEHVEPGRRLVMVHDGARPIVKADVIERLLAAFDDPSTEGAIPVMPVTDSLRMTTEVGTTAVDRSHFMAVQTPQAFRRNRLDEAYGLRYEPAMTDDASVMEAAGFDRLATVAGDEATLKITRPADLAIAALYLDK